jgi:hypothetical protein
MKPIIVRYLSSVGYLNSNIYLCILVSLKPTELYRSATQGYSENIRHFNYCLWLRKIVWSIWSNPCPEKVINRSSLN